MNRSISHLFVVVVLLFGLLVVWTSRWTVFSATALQNDSLNKIALYESWKVQRGRILADNGEVLARSTRGARGIWNREYPAGSLFAQPVGYANVIDGAFAGIEQYRDRALSGTLQSSFESVFGPITQQTTGDDVYTTLDPTAQSLARTLLDGRVGSVVAIVPQTGAVKVMYSNPSYDPTDPSACSAPDCSLLNGVTQQLYPPGSTFKVVTAAAALDSGKYTPQSTINGQSPLQVSGKPLQNDGNTSYGDVTLTDALTNSINTVFAQVGLSLGASTMQSYMQRLGFYATPPLDYPSNEMSVSGEWDLQDPKNPTLLKPTTACTAQSTYESCPDIGRMSIGQDKLLVTPLQMAMVASAVADGGTLMQPRLATRVVNSDGQVVETINPEKAAQVMKPAAAQELAQMMTDVVEEGTGQAANLEGLDAAGKTGTATVNVAEQLDDAWFIGFAPVSDPKIAVAVVLPHIVNGYGGVYAAPIAAQMMKTLLAEGY